MKRNLTIVIGMLVVMIVTSALFISKQKENIKSDLIARNIEALAVDESANCSHDTVGELVYNVYYDGYKCLKCGTTVVYGSTARCTAR